MKAETGADQFLPVVTTPDDVRALKRNVDALMVSLDATVQACEQLEEITRQNWGRFYSSWRFFFAEKESWLHAVAQIIQTQKYQAQLGDWQTLIAAKCGSNMPTVPKPGSGDSDFNSTIRTVAICGAVVAAVVGIRAVLK